uniref:Uncharacterized protein n=1 Tax=Anguilla anguilla TaxID=7936 RepID=A0A0E9UEN2_ANGAN
MSLLSTEWSYIVLDNPFVIPVAYGVVAVLVQFGLNDSSFIQ